jgi:hypothetical protein
MYSNGFAGFGAGAVIAALHSLLIAAGWSHAGDIATNHAVYTSPGVSGVDNIIVAIDNTLADRVGFRGGSAYNNGTKVLSNPTTSRFIQISSTSIAPFWLFYDLDRFVFVIKNFLAYSYTGTYCGLLDRYQVSNDMCSLITGSLTYNAVAIGFAHGSTFSGGLGALVSDFPGSYNKSYDACSLNCCFGANQLPNPVDGKIIMSPILIGKAITAIQGTLKGVFSLVNAGIASEDVIINGLDEYLCFQVYTYNFCVLK